MTADDFDTPIPRDRWGRPLVQPPGGGKPIGYTRCTTFVGCLEDTYNLSKWQQRMVATGLADRPDLLLAVAAHRGDKKEMDSLTEKALEAAKAGAAATTGTALHALTERMDRGQELGVIPEAYQADLAAYADATAGLEILAIEQFRVHDDLKIGGTTDRVVRHQGRLYIADVKTGQIDYGMGKIAMQLGVYSRSTPYDHETKQRSPDPEQVEHNWGIVIHLPAGQGRCQLRWVNLAAGWDAVQLAAQVRAWRTRRDLDQPFNAVVVDQVAPFRDAAHAASTLDDLTRLAREAALAGVWCDELRDTFTARKNALLTAA